MKVTFEKQSKALVDKIIQLRRHELATGIGSNQTTLRLILERVETSYQMYPHSTDSRMALFVANYSAELAYLIPNGHCSPGKEMMQELHELLMRSTTLLNTRKNEPCLC